MALTYHTKALPIGLQMREWVLEEVLGAGGFAIVYRGRGVYFDEAVAIKEYFPAGITDRRVDGMTVSPTESGSEETYKYGLTKFLSEARILWNLSRPDRHPNIVCVRNMFEANGTAYMVMEFEDGDPLSRMLRATPVLDAPTINSIFRPLMDGLARVHAAGVFHRDIKPGNILIDRGGRPVLIDFGSAKIRTTDAATTRFSFYTPSYAALEQYVDSMPQGPWTDIYALAATMYQSITGEKPADALVRAHTAAGEPLVNRGLAGYDPQLLAAVDAGLKVQPQDRPQTIAAWLELFPESFREKRQAVPPPVVVETSPVLPLEADSTRMQTRTQAVPPEPTVVDEPPEQDPDPPQANLEIPEILASDQETFVPDPVLPEPVVPEPVAPEPVVPEPVVPEPVAPEPVVPEPVVPEPVVTQPDEPEPFNPEPVEPAQVKAPWWQPAVDRLRAIDLSAWQRQASAGAARLRSDWRLQLGLVGGAAAVLAGSWLIQRPQDVPVPALPEPVVTPQSPGEPLAQMADQRIAGWRQQLAGLDQTAADTPKLAEVIDQATALRDSLAKAATPDAAARLFAAFNDSASMVDSLFAQQPVAASAVPDEQPVDDVLGDARTQLAGIMRANNRTARAIGKEAAAISRDDAFTAAQKRQAKDIANTASAALTRLKTPGQEADIAALSEAVQQAQKASGTLREAMRAVRQISRSKPTQVNTAVAQASFTDASVAVRRLEADIVDRAAKIQGGEAIAASARKLGGKFDRLAARTPPPGDPSWKEVAATARDIRRQMEGLLANAQSASPSDSSPVGRTVSSAEVRRLRATAERELASLRRRYVTQTDEVKALWALLDDTTGKNPAVGAINRQLTIIFDKLNRLISLQQQMEATNDGSRVADLAVQAEALRRETNSQIEQLRRTKSDFESQLP
jgi:serine/threonine protein kinase